MGTPTQFKKAFEAYMQKPAEQRKPAVEDALRKSSETAEQQKAETLKVAKEMNAELTELLKNKTLPQAVNAKGKELNKELAAAMKRNDFAAARELQVEIKALVTDATGATTTAVKDLMTARAGKAQAADTKLGIEKQEFPDLPPPEKGTAATMPQAKREEREAGNKGLSDLMAKRGEAVDWQQDEIGAVDKAVAEQKRLATVWSGLLDGINDLREQAKAAISDQAENKRKLDSELARQKEEAENKVFAEKKLAEAGDDEPQKAKWQKAITGAEAEIVESKQEAAELEKAKAEHPKLVADAQKALDDAVDAAQATLLKQGAAISEAAKAAAPKGAPKRGMEVKSPDALVAKLGLNMTPKLDVAALKDLKIPVDAKATGIDKVFPELNLVAEKHGTGRHGTQTGLDRQAGRTRSGLSPDQPGDEGGIGTADAAQPIRLEGTQTASVFLSPEVEKLAVDTAIKLVTAQCKWTEYKDGPDWKNLTNIMVRLGPPAGKPGWGVAISRIDGDGKTDPKEVKAALDDFHGGKIDFDGMLKKLNAKIGAAKADEKGQIHMEAEFVKGVAIALNRTGGGWINTTQFPVPDENRGWDLKDKTLRANAAAVEEVGPALAMG